MVQRKKFDFINVHTTKKITMLLGVCLLLLTGCSDVTTSENDTERDNNVEVALSEKYSVGDEVELGGVKFNIYRIGDTDNVLYLMANSNIATTSFSDAERDIDYMHDYEGSLIEGYVNKFVDDLEDKGLVIQSSGIINKEDLIDLGFDTDGLNGTQYRIGDAPDFVKNEEHFWVGGYCKYDTYAWVYYDGILTTEECEDEYGVRPVIKIEASELDKPIQEVDANLTIKEIVDSDCAWTSEGGIHNPYDRFYFDCENMLFTNIFESSELSATYEYSMEFVDEKTIQIEGFGKWYQIPAELTIINENRLRLRFLDDTYNDGDYYLNKVID